MVELAQEPLMLMIFVLKLLEVVLVELEVSPTAAEGGWVPFWAQWLWEMVVACSFEVELMGV